MPALAKLSFQRAAQSAFFYLQYSLAIHRRDSWLNTVLFLVDGRSAVRRLLLISLCHERWSKRIPPVLTVCWKDHFCRQAVYVWWPWAGGV